MGGGASKKYKEKKKREKEEQEALEKQGSKEAWGASGEAGRRPSKALGDAPKRSSSSSDLGRRPSKIESDQVGGRTASKQSARSSTRQSTKEIKDQLRRGSKGAAAQEDVDPREARARPSTKDAIQQSNDPSVHRFKVGDRVIGMGKIGKEYGRGTVMGLWENKSGTLRIKFDSGKEMPVKGDNLNIITAKQEEAMKNMSPAAIERLLGENGIVKDGKKS
eukprot:TRINITY_DN63540_c0_g1_i1.p1 TRINITY_DN63540_c0_g1~~TRINITY_DN63540_c0_g1_i1.p1  ORF type:complete len:220 (-),score=55.41 TRINITY_DN63540_c0_g1_i1:164-823(-)